MSTLLCQDAAFLIIVVDAGVISGFSFAVFCFLFHCKISSVYTEYVFAHLFSVQLDRLFGINGMQKWWGTTYLRIFSIILVIGLVFKEQKGFFA